MRNLFLIAATLLAAQPASAHVTVWPQQSALGAREKYAIRVANERPSDTVAIELHFPANLKVTSFGQMPGWTTELLRDAGGTIIGTRWSGKLAPMQFTEFELLATNPASGRELVWKATQIYADGTRVEWSGAPGSKTPAPRITLSPPH